jgi:hypothetical protein
MLVLVIENGVLRREEKRIEDENEYDDDIIAGCVLSAPDRAGKKWKHPTPSF